MATKLQVDILDRLKNSSVSKQRHWFSGFLFPVFQFRFNLSVFIKAYFFFQMVEKVCAKFVSKKIRKVRWQRPAAFGHPNPEYFVAGSWDDEVSFNCLNSIYKFININTL